MFKIFNQFIPVFTKLDMNTANDPSAMVSNFPQPVTATWETREFVLWVVRGGGALILFGENL